MPSTTLIESLTGPSTAAVGTNVTYALTLANTGSNAAANVSLYDYVFSPLSYVSQTQVSGASFTLSASGGTVTDTLTSLPAGASATIDIVASIPSGTANNTNLSDGASVSTTTSLSGSSVTSASLNTTAQFQADLAVSSTDPTAAVAGANITYTMTLTNNGPQAAQTVSLNVDLPSSTTYVSQSQTSGATFTLGHTGGAIIDTITSLSSGSSAVFSVTAQVNSGVPNGSVLTTTVGAATFTTDPVPGNNSLALSTAVDPVTLTAPGNQSSTEGATVSLSLSASDAVSGATLHYAAQGLPPGLKINPSTGAITGTVGLGDGAASPFTTTVTAGDGTYTASQAFTWTVTSPVTLTNPGTQTSTEGATVSLSLSASDSSSGTLSYAAIGLPPGLKINTSSGAITGTVGVGAAAGAPYRVTATAVDGTYEASQ
ncbi:MAG TPA: putative Ig domain-containing protein, partial [Gemmataceae bacterium]|nr:putative Ig domain-containing protein [Gemmataceae bacterium]